MTDTRSSVCRHCGEPILFGLYKVGPTLCAPKDVWYHPPGNQTCLRKPEGWKGVGGWPIAEPDDQVINLEFEGALAEVFEENAEVLRRLASQ